MSLLVLKTKSFLVIKSVGIYRDVIFRWKCSSVCITRRKVGGPYTLRQWSSKQNHLIVHKVGVCEGTEFCQRLEMFSPINLRHVHTALVAHAYQWEPLVTVVLPCSELCSSSPQRNRYFEAWEIKKEGTTTKRGVTNSLGPYLGYCHPLWYFLHPRTTGTGTVAVVWTRCEEKKVSPYFWFRSQ